MNKALSFPLLHIWTGTIPAEESNLRRFNHSIFQGTRNQGGGGSLAGIHPGGRKEPDDPLNLGSCAFFMPFNPDVGITWLHVTRLRKFVFPVVCSNDYGRNFSIFHREIFLLIKGEEKKTLLILLQDSKVKAEPWCCFLRARELRKPTWWVKTAPCTWTN